MAAQHTRSASSQLTTSGDAPLAVVLRIGVASLAVCALIAAATIAAHHPLGAVPALVGSAAVAGLAYRFWTRWPFWMLGLIPLAGLAPWTGWIGIDESDLLIWASIGGGYLAWSRLAPVRTPPREQSHRRALRWTLSTAVLLAACLIWTLLAMAFGVEDAGGWDFGWFQGYHEPLHAWRAAKPMVWLALLFPWWARVARRAPHRATRAWLEGMALGLALVGLGALWERWAFTSLMNFSSDYRTTSIFWEMHVGGAALDGALALAFPVALWLALRAGSRRQAVAAYGLLALATYTVMTTYSRGLYLAIVCAGAWMSFAAWRTWRARRKAVSMTPDASATIAPASTLSSDLASTHMPTSPAMQVNLLRALLTVGIGAVIAGALVFVGGGYRGLLAFLATFAVLLVQRGSRTAVKRTGAGVLLLMGLPLAVVTTFVAAVLAFPIPKSAYGLFAIAWLLALVLAVRSRKPRKRPMERLTLVAMGASWSVCIGLTGVVAWYWGDANALVTSVPALVLVLPLWSVWHGESAVEATRHTTWREPAGVLAGVILVAGALAVILGGTRISERLQTGADDLAVRLEHWQSSMKVLDDADAWFTGIGAGRFVSRRLFSVPREERVGDYRLEQLDGERFVRIIGGQHTMGGAALRVSQRIAAPPSELTLTADVRSAAGAQVLFELCEKHLLYAGSCFEARTVSVGPAEGARPEWQTVRVDWRNQPALGGALLPPRGVVFSASLAGRGQSVDVRSMALTDHGGRDLLHNGAFSEDLSRWFYTSDHHHLPWHIKSLPLHVLFEQGLVGLTLWAALVGGALWRVTFGWGRNHPLAPVLASALIGFIVVGLFDSLIDASRVAFVFYAAVLLALGVRTPGEAQGRRSRRRRRREAAHEPAPRVS